MDKQEQNEALAKWLSERTGNRYCIQTGFLVRLGATIDKPFENWDAFTKSLDSMALIEGAMTDDEFRAYAARCTDAYALGKYVFDFDGYAVGMEQVRTLLRLTPAQRAEAACRALGLWSESEAK